MIEVAQRSNTNTIDASKVLPEWLTDKELMAKFQISRETLSAWVVQDYLPKPTKIGRRCVWNAAQVRQRLARLGKSA